MKARPMMDRLEAVFDIVPHAESIADIGTDHGYLAVELIVRGKANALSLVMFIRALWNRPSPMLHLEGLAM